MTTSTVNSTAPASTPKVVPSEVGWQFVPQYYTFLNKQPHRLHCFYTKNSTFIHGTEGEDGKPCYGQQEIHNKILSIGFQDCKVFIHSVDAQSSANNGIIIQVIGEMSNQGEPWRKFAQTFFLAEQPNGYFVLNDIFRYLKEETYGEEEGSEGGEPSVDSNPATADVVDQPSSAPTAPEPVSSGPSEVAPAPEEAAPVQINGYHPEHEQSVDSVTVDVAPSQDEPATVEEPPRSPTPAPEPVTVPADPSPLPSPPPAPATELPVESPAPAPATTSTPTPAPAPAPVRVTTPAPAPAAPQAPAPSVPKTWANLAAANSNKWGPQVAQEAKGVSAAPAPSPAPVASASSSTAVDGPRSASQSGKQDKHPAAVAAMAVTTAQCFVKSVTEVVSQQALRDTLTQRFGPVKELEIVRNKACAFLEFTTVDAARRAILASLPIQQGGEGGIRIDGEGGQYQRISVEIRKERGDRPVSRPRVGGPNGGEPRGTFNRGRGRGGGRGGPPTGTDAGSGRGTAR